MKKVHKRVVSKSFGQLLLSIEELRKQNSSMTLNTAVAFLVVANEQGITGNEVNRRIGVGSSAGTRMLASLSEHHRKGIPGLKLVRYETDVLDRRVKHLYLTNNGERVWASLKRILEIET